MFLYKGEEYFKDGNIIYRVCEDGNFPLAEINWLRLNKNLSQLTLVLYNHFCKPEIINYKGDI